MKALKTIFIGMVALALATAPAYGEPGKGKGEDKGKGHDKQTEVQSTKGNQSGNAQTGQTSETRRHVTEKARRDADVRKNRPVKENSLGASRKSTRVAYGRDNPRTKGGVSDKARLIKLADALNSLKAQRAKWNHNPHDERGQGNMGKPDMRDPYGHDKESGREKGERGRRIKPALDADAYLGFSLLDYLVESGALSVSLADLSNGTYQWQWKSNQFLVSDTVDRSGSAVWEHVAFDLPYPQMEVDGKTWDLTFLWYEPAYKGPAGYDPNTEIEFPERYTAYLSFPGTPELKAWTWIFPDTAEIQYLDRSISKRVTSTGEIGFQNTSDKAIYIDIDGDGNKEEISPRGTVYINKDQISAGGQE